VVAGINDVIAKTGVGRGVAWRQLFCPLHMPVHVCAYARFRFGKGSTSGRQAVKAAPIQCDAKGGGGWHSAAADRDEKRQPDRSRDAWYVGRGLKRFSSWFASPIKPVKSSAAQR